MNIILQQRKLSYMNMKQRNERLKSREQHFENYVNKKEQNIDYFWKLWYNKIVE